MSFFWGTNIVEVDSFYKILEIGIYIIYFLSKYIFNNDSRVGQFANIQTRYTKNTQTQDNYYKSDIRWNWYFFFRVRFEYLAWDSAVTLSQHHCHFDHYEKHHQISFINLFFYWNDKTTEIELEWVDIVAIVEENVWMFNGLFRAFSFLTGGGLYIQVEL